eukprot:SAG31_NODE_575_length_13961_cov_41.577550_6_plen_398_part_00
MSHLIQSAFARLLMLLLMFHVLTDCLQTSLFLCDLCLVSQRHDTIANAWAGADKTLTDKLEWVNNFTAETGPFLDVVSWHTYDFHAADIGLPDHTPLDPSNESIARLWSTEYLDLALVLAQNVTALARKNAHHASVWLSETNSICHQGVSGATNAYLNSLWLVNRLGLMANNNVSVMARQSLVGYNYSLLGNWPVEQIAPNPVCQILNLCTDFISNRWCEQDPARTHTHSFPLSCTPCVRRLQDYFTTILFKRLFGNQVLGTTASASALLANRSLKSGDRARAYAFCAKSGGVAVALINFDSTEAATFRFTPTSKLGSERRDYLLSPGAQRVVESFKWSAREILLNGIPLRMAPDGALPDAVVGHGKVGKSETVTLGPLEVGFVMFPAAAEPTCQEK